MDAKRSGAGVRLSLREIEGLS